MIAYLHGLIQQKEEDSLVLNVNGVGYLLRITKNTLNEIEIGEELRFFVHTQVSENSFTLYAFLEKDELDFFKQLITVSGVGPKTALGILGSPVDVVKQGIASEDADLMSKFPGIGKKTAERIIVELKGKVTFTGELKISSQEKLINNEALDALQSLGYAKYEALQMLNKVPEDVEDLEEKIKQALSSK